MASRTTTCEDCGESYGIEGPTEEAIDAAEAESIAMHKLHVCGARLPQVET